jgi:osmotically inducible lipoprotein OsmB
MVLAGVSLAGCGASTTDRALIGAGIGVGAGAIGGALLGNPLAGAAIGAAAGAGVGVATTPAERTEPAAEVPPAREPDHVVTTYATPKRGPKAARVENRREAIRTCGSGVALIREASGRDERGRWFQLVYGCVVEDHPLAQTSGR